MPGSTKWKRVGHLPGAILINTGEILSIWSQKRYPALLHRVIIPEQESVRVRGRHSLAFFCHPGNWTFNTILMLNLNSSHKIKKATTTTTNAALIYPDSMIIIIFVCLSHLSAQITALPFSLLIFQPSKHQFVIKRRNLKDVHLRLLKISKYATNKK